MRKRYFSNVVAAGIAFFIVVHTINVTGQNTLTLDINRATDIIGKTIYGGLLEHWGRDIYTGLYVGRNSPIPNTLGIRNDIIEGMKECGVGVLEWPGGCFSSEYRWLNGIGPVEDRPLGDINEDRMNGNGMGTDDYMELCNLLDIEPYICCNTVNGSPKESAEWIRYINDNQEHPEWHVKYWHIGNEPWGC
ncbi:MAG: hypothetical protein JW863_20145 [Chitinispirillaceae bacterium]|nr:hypothetical protein [Chitinispirillaceae bacterium]